MSIRRVDGTARIRVVSDREPVTGGIRVRSQNPWRFREIGAVRHHCFFRTLQRCWRGSKNTRGGSDSSDQTVRHVETMELQRNWPTSVGGSFPIPEVRENFLWDDPAVRTSIVMVTRFATEQTSQCGILYVLLPSDFKLKTNTRNSQFLLIAAES